MKKQVDIGKAIRYERIFNPSTGKTVLIPLDHGILQGPIPGIENPAETIRQVISGGANGVIFNAGLASSLYPEYMNRCGSIFNLTNAISDPNNLTIISSVEYAVRNCADGISVQVIVGSPNELDMLRNACKVANKCARWGIPLLAMVYPTEEVLLDKGKAVELLAARAGAELGADIVKTSYTGDRQSFKMLVDTCPVPLVIAGGPQKDTLHEVLEMVEDAMACGAAGVALGRNVWQSKDPIKTTKAIVDIVHHGKSVKELEWL